MKWLCGDAGKYSYLKPICRPYESLRAIDIRLDDEDILICSRLGAILETIPLNEVTWRPCALPGKDNCISFQFKNPQSREVLFKASNKKVIQDITSLLDKAAERLAQNPASEQGPESPQSVVDSDPVSVDSDDRSKSEEYQAPQIEDNQVSSADCTRCLEVSKVFQENELHLQKIEALHLDLDVCKKKLQQVEKEREDQSQVIVSVNQKLKIAQEAKCTYERRCQELEESLHHANAKCEKLIKEVSSAKKSALAAETKSKDIQASLDATEEENRLLIAALTTAQAQLHDTNSAFKEVSHQLQSYSEDRVNSKEDANQIKRKLSDAVKQMEHYKSELEVSHNEIDSLREQLSRAKDELGAAKTIFRSIEETSAAEMRKELERSQSHSKVEMDMLQREIDVWTQHCSDMDKDLSKLQSQLAEERMARQRAEEALSLMMEQIKASPENQSTIDCYRPSSSPTCKTSAS